MEPSSSAQWTKTTIRIASAGLGAAIAGPLGGALGSILGHALGESTEKLIGTYLEKFGEEAGKKFLDTSSDSLIEKLKKSGPDLEALYRKSLALSLAGIRPQIGSGIEDCETWFTNWDKCLQSPDALRLDAVEPGQLVPANLDALFVSTMERLDAQGQLSRRKSTSIRLQTRALPEPLAQELKSRLPQRFEQTFRDLIVLPEYQVAWNQAELIFRESFSVTLTRIDQRTEVLPKVAEDTAATREEMAAMRRMFEEFRDSAFKKGEIPEEALQAKDDEIARLIAEKRKLEEELAARSEPGDLRIAKLLDAGDFDGALRIKSQQIESLRETAAKLPRDLYELGKIQELRFEWPQALATYKEAWELGKQPQHGFYYAWFSAKLNHFSEAIAVYRQVLNLYTDPAERALVLNNLSIPYLYTQRIKEGEQALTEALAIRRKLAKKSPDDYLPDVAMTLNNLAILYRDTQRLKKAERTYDEALATYRRLAEKNPSAYLSDVAMTLNNLASLYSGTQRMQQAEKAFGEAFAIYRKLAEEDPDAWLSDVGMTLNNLGILYSDTQLFERSEEAYTEALVIFGRVTEKTPDTGLPDVAMTLNNLAILYSTTQRSDKAEQAFAEALAIRRSLADESADDAWLPQVANTLMNLGNFCIDMRRFEQAEKAYEEALASYSKLAEANPEVYLPDVANALNNLSILYRKMERLESAGESLMEALAIRRALAEENPEAWLESVAAALNNLGNLYSDTERLEEAEAAYEEALAIYQALAKKNPHSHLPSVANTLNNLTNFFILTNRDDEANPLILEAEKILTPFWQKHPQVHGDSMARILWNRAQLAGFNEDVMAESCPLGRRALAAAYERGLRQSIQNWINRYCAEPGPDLKL